VRYCDDHLLGFIGPKAEAEEIKTRLAAFLREDLTLELSEEKTLITHARTGAARFLGYEITVRHGGAKKLTRGRRSANGSVGLRVPITVIKAKCAPYLKLGKPECRPQLMNLDDHQIISIDGAEYRGLVQYYLLASDVHRLSRVHWVMLTSMLKTLAAKHRTTVTKMARKYQARIDTAHGRRSSFQASVERDGRKPLVARFGGIPLTRQKKAVLHDHQPAPLTTRRKGKELIHRLRAGRCEWCEHGPTCTCTTSAHSPISRRRGSHNPRGLSSWPRNGARPSWSAGTATTPSTRSKQPRHHGVITRDG
jgi:hypothetical protein